MTVITNYVQDIGPLYNINIDYLAISDNGVLKKNSFCLYLCLI
jgi:hypothetical protein